MLAIWSLVPLSFLNLACIPESSWFTYCWCLAWRNLSISLLAWNEYNCVNIVLNILWHCPSLVLEWKLTFSSPLATAEFSKFAGSKFSKFECSTLTASSLRISKSSAGISSPPLALFVVRLPNAHLTSHSRMSGCRWMLAIWSLVPLSFLNPDCTPGSSWFTYYWCI